MLQFRALRTDEIEVRVSECRQTGVSLLLYKDARCDMAILDETVTPMGWQRKHYECKGNLFCSVGIIDGDKECADTEWIWKSDAGASGNFEAEKSESSDSFKRACFNWGIGRELYTAPRIWVPSSMVNVRQNQNGRWACYDKFKVEKVLTVAHSIMVISIVNTTTNMRVFSWVRPGFNPQQPKSKPDEVAKVLSPDFVPGEGGSF